MGHGDVDLSIESENRRCIRLFRQSEGGWRRVAPNENGSWTLAPSADGTLEIGIGVLMSEAAAPWSASVAAGVHRMRQREGADQPASARALPRVAVHHPVGTRSGR